MAGKLYLVATPIGNLNDISDRAARTLEEVDFIAAEDTRVTQKLLNRLGIKKTLISYYKHNSRQSGEYILKRLLDEEDCALVTDAGTPGISDPGEEVVRLCSDTGIEILTIPGPCAAISALTLSGLPTGRFTFEGFLSTSRKSRFEHLEELKTEKRTMIFYEAPHKLNRTLNDMLTVFGDRCISLSRELTKIHEETIRCHISEAISHFSETPPRGEFVIIIEGITDTTANNDDFSDAFAIAIDYRDKGYSAKDAAKKTSDETGISKNAIYKALISDVEV